MEARNFEQLAEEEAKQMHAEKCVESHYHPVQLDVFAFVLIELVIISLESECD